MNNYNIAMSIRPHIWTNIPICGQMATFNHKYNIYPHMWEIPPINKPNRDKGDRHIQGRQIPKPICTMVVVMIKGTACGLYSIVPLSDHSLYTSYKLYTHSWEVIPSSGSYTMLWQLYHGWETIVQAMTLSWFIRIAPSWLTVKPLGYASCMV